MGEFNSEENYIYYYGQEFLTSKGATLIVNKRVQNAVLGCSLKTTEWSVFKANLQYHSTPAYSPIPDAKEAEVDQFYEDPQELLELMPKKKKSFSL